MRMLGQDAARTRVTLVGGGALLVVVLLAVAVSTATGRHGPEKAVEEAVESYMDADRDGGSAAIKEHLCTRDQQTTMLIGTAPGSGSGSPKITDIQVSGHKALVTLEYDVREDGRRQTRTFTLRLVQEGETWRVCFTRANPWDGTG
jgi:hypothetical protein